MKIPRAPHSWALTPRQAIAVQKRLASMVSHTAPPGTFRWAAGMDAAFSSDKQYCLSAVVLWDIAERRVVEEHTARRRLRFPYIPGLLSFREAPALLAALRKLTHSPDVLLCDGQGLAHPRRLGLACHVGIICDLPAIGCAKSRLIGVHEEPALKRGSQTPLIDHAQMVGEVLRTQTGKKPIYLSIGHRMDLPTAEQLVLACAIQYRLPEPTRLADQLVAVFKRECEKAVASS
jgi:deoxyribonuclease V